MKGFSKGLIACMQLTVHVDSCSHCNEKEQLSTLLCGILIMEMC